MSFVLNKPCQHRNHCREHREGPCGPAGFPPLDDRIDQQDQAKRPQRDPSATPARSSVARLGPRDSRIIRDTRVIATRPIGILTRKIDLHDQPNMFRLTSRPPKSCAVTEARPIDALYMPIAIGRSDAANSTRMMART